MQTSQDDDLGRLYEVEDAVGKAAKQVPPHLRIDGRTELRVLRDLIEGRIESTEEAPIQAASIAITLSTGTPNAPGIDFTLDDGADTTGRVYMTNSCGSTHTVTVRVTDSDDNVDEDEVTFHISVVC